MLSSTTSPPVRTDSSTAGSAVAKRYLWEEAWDTLSVEDRKLCVENQEVHDEPVSDMLCILKNIQEVTERKKRDCEAKGWSIYQNKQGKKVQLRHVLEKMAVWVHAVVKVVDKGVSLDQSAHASLSWALIKSILLTAFSEIELFSSAAEGLEAVSSLISRYTIIEKLYLHENVEASQSLHEAIRILYAAVLTYLIRVKSYLADNTLKRIGRGLIEGLRRQHDNLYKKISETQVDKWVRLVERQIDNKTTRNFSENYRSLKGILLELNKPIIQINHTLAAFQDNLAQDERIKMFRWMSEVDYRSHHRDLSKEILPNSGQWLLENEHFIDWAQSSTSSLLWLHGIPGSGKTRLVSTVINAMFDAVPTPVTSSIAFFYCARSTSEPERARPDEIMRAILRQLAGSKSDMPVKEPVLREYEKRRAESRSHGFLPDKPLMEDCTRLILEISEESTVTIIIDALDECDDSDRWRLFEDLDKIISKSTNIVKVFVSSRDDIDIKKYFGSSKNISISATDNGSDIERFIETEVDRLIAKRLLLNGKVKKKLKAKIITTLKEGAQGMFRWVSMSLETLRGIKFEPDFKEALGKLPSKLSELYEIVYSEIKKERPHGRDTAINTLRWLLCAQRLLSVSDLIAAVAVEFEAESIPDSEDSETDLEDSSAEEAIIRLCRNLVIIDSEEGVFRFAHQSVREYLIKQAEFTLVEQHSFAMQRCLSVLASAHPRCDDNWDWEPEPRDLTHYAKMFWLVHYKYVEDHEESTDLVLQFATQEESETPSGYEKWASSFSFETFKTGCTRHLLDHPAEACVFGLLPLLRRCELSSVHINHYVLGRAAGDGNIEVVKCLLEKGVEVNDLNRGTHSALYAAATNGHKEIEKLLVEKGAEFSDDDRLAAYHVITYINNRRYEFPPLYVAGKVYLPSEEFGRRDDNWLKLEKLEKLERRSRYHGIIRGNNGGANIATYRRITRGKASINLATYRRIAQGKASADIA